MVVIEPFRRRTLFLELAIPDTKAREPVTIVKSLVHFCFWCTLPPRFVNPQYAEVLVERWTSEE